MRRLRRVFIASLTVLSLINIAYAKPLTPETRYLPKINTLVVNGPINIVLNGVKKTSFPILQIPSADRGLVSIDTNHHVLTIKSNGLDQKNSPLVLNQFNSGHIVALNAARITGKNLFLKNARLVVKDNNTKVNLSGHLKLNNIQQSGHSVCRLTGIKSGTFDLSQRGNSYLFLAGKAQHLFIHMQDQANLDAKKLNVETVWIAAKNNALAHINPTTDLRANATDNAQVYFYHFLYRIKRHTDKHANVLKI